MSVIKRYFPIAVLLIFAVALALAPAIQIFFETKGVWRGVIPEYPNDAMFYFARMVQVGHGHYFIGNPYIWEYRMAPALSFFVADWLTAVPLLLGVSLTATIVFNLAFWSVLFCIIGYILFLKLELTPWQSVAATLLSYLQVYWLMLRPVVMQTVFPSYLLFLLAYLLWFKAPTSKKRVIFLAISSAVTFYIYTFLWQIVCISFAFTYAYLLIKKKWIAIRALAVSNIMTVILAMPMFVYIFKQVASQFYWESLIRVNLVYSRLPTAEVYYYGRWVVLAVLLCLIFRLRKPSRQDADKESELFAIVCITGLSLLAASASNVILDKEVDTATHIGRFIILWFSIIFCTILVYLWPKIGKDVRISRSIKAGVIAVLLVVSLGYMKNFSRATSLLNIDQSEAVFVQDYAAPLNWLDKNATPEQVVWALNPRVGGYIPVLTHNYALFNLSAAFYLMPSSELAERYLVSQYFSNPSAADLERLSPAYSGFTFRNKYREHNYLVNMCHVFYLEKLGYNCGSIETIKGDPYFSQLRDIYINKIVPNINSELAKYHVTYLVIDKERDQLKRPLRNLKGLTLAYKDARFEIYKIGNK